MATRRFWFETEEGDCRMNDHVGYLKGAITKAQKYANEHNCTVYINEGEDIVECCWAEEVLNPSEKT